MRSTRRLGGRRSEGRFGGLWRFGGFRGVGTRDWAARASLCGERGCASEPVQNSCMQAGLRLLTSQPANGDSQIAQPISGVEIRIFKSVASSCTGISPYPLRYDCAQVVLGE